MVSIPGLERYSDRDLVALIASREGDALAVFYRRYLPRILGYLVRETGDREAAADLAAEVFAAVMIAANRYRSEADDASAWVFGIARNKLAESQRRGIVEDRARRRLGFQPIALQDSDLERVEEIVSTAAPVGQLVNQLPADERQAVLEHVVHDRGYREIAGELHCSELVVRKRVSRGLRRMRSALLEE